MCEEANRVAVSSEDDAPPSQTQQQETTVDNEVHRSIDGLLKAIKGANGMPVLFVPSSNGRLAAVAVDGLQNLMPHNRNKKQEALLSLLLLVASLVATVTFTAGLSPPGGFWAANDKEKGYVAGTSVMSDKFPTRHRLFQNSIALAFFFSLMIIVVLAKSINNKNEATFVRTLALPFLTAGTWDIHKSRIWIILAFALILVYMFMPWVMSWTQSRKQPLDQSLV